MGNAKLKVGEGVSSPKKKEVFRNSPQKVFQGSPRKGRVVPNLGRNLLSVINAMDGVMVGGNAQLWKT